MALPRGASFDLSGYLDNTDTQLDSTDIANLGYVAGSHTVDTDTQLDSTDIANFGYVAGSDCGLSIGDTYQGGIIFYLDASGCHGLIGAQTDQSTGISWDNGSGGLTNAVRDGIGAGKINTERIIAVYGVGNYAAQFCADYQGGNYGDWYLPSRFELDLMRDNIGQGNVLGLGNIGGFDDEYYWSSTEYNINNVLVQFFLAGNIFNIGKSNARYVRAVRAL